MIRTVKLIVGLFALAVISPVAMQAQKADKDKDKKKEVEQIIITKDGTSKEKMTIVVDGDKVTVNGKDVKDLKDNDVTIRRIQGRDGIRSFSINGDDVMTLYGQNYNLFAEDENKAMLGVVTDREEGGAKISQVTKESAAAKAGLKEGDIITKVNDKTISDPDDLTKAIQSHKPGDKVSITYLRDKKSQKTPVELGKWKGIGMKAFNMSPGTAPDLHVFERTMPRIQGELQQMQNNFAWTMGRPKLGVSVQDTEDGKGVKVIDVEEESNAAKAGILKDDIISSVDGQDVNSTDEIAKIVRSSKDKPSMMVKLTRGGKVYNMEVKIPRKLKTTDL